MIQGRGAQWYNDHSSILARPQRSLLSSLLQKQSHDGVLELDRTSIHTLALQSTKICFPLKQRGFHLKKIAARHKVGYADILFVNPDTQLGFEGDHVVRSLVLSVVSPRRV